MELNLPKNSLNYSATLPPPYVILVLPLASTEKWKVTVENKTEARDHITSYQAKLNVEVGDEVHAGDKLTQGTISPKELLAVTDPITTQQYILKEIQDTYRSQGVEISDKHVEVIAKRMINKIRIIDGGDTSFITGAVVNFNQFTVGNRDAIINGKKPAIGKPILLGITKAALGTNSFLSAASFQETTKVLTEAVIQDPSSGEILYNLAQDDMVALRVTMRLGWEIPNPINALEEDASVRFPFSAILPGSYNEGRVNVTFTVSDQNSSPVKDAKVNFNGEIKYTNASGHAVFKSNTNSSGLYRITAENMKRDVVGEVTVASSAVSVSETINIVGASV